MAVDHVQPRPQPVVNPHLARRQDVPARPRWKNPVRRAVEGHVAQTGAVDQPLGRGVVQQPAGRGAVGHPIALGRRGHVIDEDRAAQGRQRFTVAKPVEQVDLAQQPQPQPRSLPVADVDAVTAGGGIGRGELRLARLKLGDEGRASQAVVRRVGRAGVGVAQRLARGGLIGARILAQLVYVLPPIEVRVAQQAIPLAAGQGVEVGQIVGVEAQGDNGRAAQAQHQGGPRYPSPLGRRQIPEPGRGRPSQEHQEGRSGSRSSGGWQRRPPARALPAIR